jgi:hypothetical protein
MVFGTMHRDFCVQAGGWHEAKTITEAIFARFRDGM